MITFLPYPNFRLSMKSLDYKRLGKQRVEAKQLLDILENKSTGNGYRSHPALKMWAGYEDALKYYINLSIEEWISRGYKNTMTMYELSEGFKYPWWFGDSNFHRAMRSRLIAKDEKFYLPVFGELDKNFNDGKYFWPVNESKTFRII